MKNILSLFIAIFLFNSCQQKELTNSCNGVWESIGHGQILEIRDSSLYAFYHITSTACVPSRKSSFNEIEPGLTLLNDTLSLVSGSILYKFTRSKKLPKLCAFFDNEKANDIMHNFEVFMETVKEHYAFLELNKINWDELYKTQKEKLNADPTAAKLYLIIEETFEKLNDNHAFLEANDDNLYDELDELEAEESIEEEVAEIGDFQVANTVAKHYLIEDMTKDSWLIKWGKMEGGIGYVQIITMWLYAYLDLKQEQIDDLGFLDAFGSARSKMLDGNYIEKEVEGLEKIMNKVMSDLANTKSIVMDVRFNGGGQDQVSLKILSYFNAKNIHVSTSKFRYGDKFTEPHKQYLDGNPNAYTNSVYILTSPQSGSAAEVFSLASMHMPNITRIGSATEGATSTTLDKKLPIGWDFCVSNEVFMDTKGKCYENIGIPVDYELNYLRGRQEFFGYILDNLEKDKQDVLRAIEDIETKSGNK